MLIEVMTRNYLRKAFVKEKRRRHKGVLAYTLVEWPGLFDSRLDHLSHVLAYLVKLLLCGNYWMDRKNGKCKTCSFVQFCIPALGSGSGRLHCHQHNINKAKLN